MANDEERKFRLRPRKPAVRRERRPLATAYKIIMHYARMSGVRKRRSSFGTGPKRSSALLPAMRGACHVGEEHHSRAVASTRAVSRA